MRRGLTLKLAGGMTLLAAILVLTVLGSGTAMSEVRSIEDVVMMRCSAVAGQFIVKEFGGSPNAPAQREDSCPANLALLHKEGFRLADVGYSDVEGRFIVYTLLR